MPVENSQFFEMQVSSHRNAVRSLMELDVGAAAASVVAAHQRRVAELQAREAAASGRCQLIRELLLRLRSGGATVPQSPCELAPISAAPRPAVKHEADAALGQARLKRPRTEHEKAPAAIPNYPTTLALSRAAEGQANDRSSRSVTEPQRPVIDCDGEGELLLGQDDERDAHRVVVPVQQDCTPPVLREECELLFPSSFSLAKQLPPPGPHPHDKTAALPFAANRTNAVAKMTKSAFTSAFEKEKHPRALKSSSSTVLGPVTTTRTKQSRSGVLLQPDDDDAEGKTNSCEKQQAADASMMCTPAEYWSVAFPALPPPRLAPGIASDASATGADALKRAAEPSA